jgi:transcriptional regulator with XRE-family HTH domain
MHISPTAEFLKKALDQAPLTQREVAERAGFQRPNILSMMKNGETKVPLNRIPELARACEVKPSTFIRVAMKEYHPEVWAILEDIFDGCLTPAEEEMMMLFRIANVEGDVQMTETLSSALLAVLELGRAAPDTDLDDEVREA